MSSANVVDANVIDQWGRTVRPNDGSERWVRTMGPNDEMVGRHLEGGMEKRGLEKRGAEEHGSKE